MSASTATGDAPVASERRPGTALVVLAAVEARRLARHPVFLVGVAAYVLLLLDLLVLTRQRELWQLTDSVTFSIALCLGIGGFIAMNRLAGATRDSDAVVAVPAGETTQTWALCLACLLPLAIAGAGAVAVALVYVADPASYQEVPGRVDAGAHIAYLAAAWLSALGGPLLGVTVARWWRWPTAGLVGAVGLIVWSFLGIGPTLLAIDLVHLSAPYTILITGPTEGELYVLGGNLGWRLPYVAGLCALAAIAAALHGAHGEARRRLLRVLAVVAAVTVTCLVLSAVTGPDLVRLR
ncbi:hypothetical protein [Georgenia subflava]|uniref:Uncharacterized protein n=1 Tax=Georgenia subflava TaxID=1622177 RepID=A0A6N7EH36_9MICO|nr:hypothetical protein [Georgenia subflava]MPV37360.1 hypothetical protein [Georgenia subflava]